MLLVVGATGDLGGRIVRRLSETGEHVRALVRPATDATALVDQGVEVVRGDIRYATSLPPALEGVDTVVTTANAIGRMMAGRTDLTMTAVDGDGNQHLILAAERAGVARFVFVSAAGIGQEMARLSPMMAGKWRAEWTLLSTSMRAVLVRPGMFQESWLTPPLFDPRAGTALIRGRGRTPHRYVATDDVAALCAHLAVAPEPPKVVEFGGPDALTELQVVAAFEDATGKTFKVRRVPRAVLSVGRRILAPVSLPVAMGMGMSLYFDTHPDPWDDAPLREAGIEPRPARDFIASTVALAA